MCLHGKRVESWGVEVGHQKDVSLFLFEGLGVNL